MSVVSISISGESQKHIQRCKLRGERLVKKLPEFLNSAANELVSELIVNEFGRGKTLNVVTSMLRSNTTYRIQGGGTATKVYVGVTKGPAAEYAAIQDRGGTIRAKGKGALAVPLPSARTPSGRPKYPGGPREAEEKLGELFFYDRSEDGKPPLLCRVHRTKGSGKGKGKAESVEPLFVLLKSVKIPASKWLTGGVRRAYPVFRDSLVQDIDNLLGGK